MNLLIKFMECWLLRAICTSTHNESLNPYDGNIILDGSRCWLSQFAAGGSVQRGEGDHLHPAEAAHGEHTHRHWRRLHPVQGVRDQREANNLLSFQSSINIFRIVPAPSWCDFPLYKARLQRMYWWNWSFYLFCIFIFFFFIHFLYWL